jgi:hypothetical protein
MAAAAASLIFEAGSWVWMPHDEEMYVPAKVTKKTFRQGEAGELQTEDGKVRNDFGASVAGAARARVQGGQAGSGLGRRPSALPLPCPGALSLLPPPCGAAKARAAGRAPSLPTTALPAHSFLPHPLPSLLPPLPHPPPSTLPPPPFALLWSRL